MICLQQFIKFFFFLRKFFYKLIWCIKEIIYWLYIKTINLRSFNRDWKLTKKFFLKTTGVYLCINYIFTKNFFLLSQLGYSFNLYFESYKFILYWAGKSWFLLRHFLSIPLHQVWVMDLWTHQKTAKLVYFWVPYDASDRRRRWGKFLAYLTRKNMIILKYPFTKRTSWEGDC